MNRKRCKLLVVAATGIILLGSTRASAQNLINTNAADLGDARANLINPAIVPLQDALFTMGSKVLYWGLSDNGLDLRNSYFSLTTSNRSIGGLDHFGYGLQGQVLQTPLYNAVSMNAVLAKRVHERLSLGVNIGFMNRGFDRSGFLLEDENDPAFASLSKWVFPDVGVGLVATPNRHLTVGFSVNHLTRPNIALQDSAQVSLPRSFSLGASVGMGFFRAIFGVTKDHEDVLPSVAFESFRQGVGLLKVGYGREAATLEAQLQVMSGVSFNYRYSYPVNNLRLATSGSHELSFVFNFKKHSTIYVAEWLEPDITRPPVINPNTAFVVESVFDSLLIVDRHITRQVDSTITQEELAALPRYILVKGDSLEPDLPSIGAARLSSYMEMANGNSDGLLDSTAIYRRLKRDHTERYLKFLKILARRLDQDTTMTARIVVPADVKRVRLLLDYLALHGKITDRLKIAVRDSSAERDKFGGQRLPEKVNYTLLSVEADTFKFDLNVPELRYGPVSYEFRIADADNNVLHKLVGDRQIRPYYVWNWRLDNGELIPPGVYYYYIQWQAEDGTQYTSPKQNLVIGKEENYIDIRISKSKFYDGKPGGRVLFYVN